MKNPRAPASSPPIPHPAVPIVSSKPRSGCGNGVACCRGACGCLMPRTTQRRDGFCVRERWRGAEGHLATPELGMLEPRERRDWRHGRSGCRRRRFDRLQALAQLRHWFMASARRPGHDRNHEREETKGRRTSSLQAARQNVNRPRPQPGCNPVCALSAKSSNQAASNVARFAAKDMAFSCHNLSSLHALFRSSGTAGLRPSCCRPISSSAAAFGLRAPAPCREADDQPLGDAIGERARICRAISISSRCGLSMQAAAKALAVERLIPA